MMMFMLGKSDVHMQVEELKNGWARPREDSKHEFKEHADLSEVEKGFGCHLSMGSISRWVSLIA